MEIYIYTCVSNPYRCCCGGCVVILAVVGYVRSMVVVEDEDSRMVFEVVGKRFNKVT